MAWYSAGVRSSIIGFSFLAVQPDLELLDDLLIRRIERVLCGFRFYPTFVVLLHFDQKFGSRQIAVEGWIDDLDGDGLSFGHFSAPVFILDHNPLIQNLAQQFGKVS